MAHRDFDAARAEDADEPLTFHAAGRDFTASRVKAGPLLALAELAVTDEEGSEQAVAVGRLINDLIDQKDEWQVALSELDLPVVLAIGQWLVEESVGRPTETPSRSQRRRSSTGASSNGASKASASATLST